MKTFQEIYRDLEEQDYFKRLSLTPLAQFGTEQEPLLGARLLPETLVQENAYTEDQVRYATVPALAGPHYGPAQMQSDGTFRGTLKVELGNNDTARQMDSQTYRGVNNLLMQSNEMQATANLLGWVDQQLIRPHVVKAEIERWEAITRAQVTRKGTEGYSEIVSLHAPNGHRPTVSGGTTSSKAGWYSDTYDPYDDIALGVQTLEDKGYAVTDMICTGKLRSVMKSNGEIAKRSNKVIVNASGQISSVTGRVTNADLLALHEEDGYPPLQVYNLGYPSLTGYKRYLDSPNDDRDYFIILGRTGLMWDMKTDYVARTEGRVDGYDAELIQTDVMLNNTFGYYGIGKCAGMASPGRQLHTEMQMRKPKGMYGESYQEGLPVIQSPEAIYIIQVLRPTT
ncbi:MAG: hypothetical protein ACFB0G_11120 [Leptolyngbyaceae cyanobacterium]|mgnify:CR=1 FL=1